MNPEKDNIAQHEPDNGPSRRLHAFLKERMQGDSTSLGRSNRSVTAGPEGEEQETEQQKSVAWLASTRLQRLRKYRNRKLNKLRRIGISRGHIRSPRDPVQSPPDNNWISLGPSGVKKGQADTKPIVSGRTQGIAIAPGGTRIYVATANGGVWRSVDTGRTWLSLMDKWDEDPKNFQSDSLACGAIALVPGNSPADDLIYVGSGEGQNTNRRGSGFTSGGYNGVGPIISTDGGQTWRTETTPSLEGKSFYGLAVDPNDRRRVVAATTNGIYRRSGPLAAGVWTQVGFGGTRITDVVVASNNEKTVFYAATIYGKVYFSENGSDWNELGSDFPTSRVGRIGLAVNPQRPGIVYALIALGGNDTASSPAKFGNFKGVYRFEDTDEKWHQLQFPPAGANPNPVDFLFSTDPMNKSGQGFYDMTIALAPDNSDRIYIGGSAKRGPGGAFSAALYRCEVTVNRNDGGILNISAAETFIGAAVHSDVHKLVFTPNQPGKLWVGCDGGVFYTTQAATGIGEIFKDKNAGLQTLCMNHIGQHPTEDGVIFCGSQDNGGLRYTGEEIWLHSIWGDCGYFVVNWKDTRKILGTYNNDSILRSTSGGERYDYNEVGVTLANNEEVLFYAPIVGTPPDFTASNADQNTMSDIVAFGTMRPLISTGFGGGWKSIPNNNFGGANSDSLGSEIRSMVFATAQKLYVGTMDGQVHYFECTDFSWNSGKMAAGTPKQLDTTGGGNDLASNIGGRPITDIVVDPDNDDRIYVSIGGSPGLNERVWFFDGADWEERSGIASGNDLEDIQFNALVVDPVNPDHLYAAADIGVWHSDNRGLDWEIFSEGLPDAAVIDLKIHHRKRPDNTDQLILRASTFGRGVFERTLPDTDPKFPIELYLRDTSLDQGRINFPTQLDPALINPKDVTSFITEVDSPDIKADVPDANGNYQYPIDGSHKLNFGEFMEELEDRSDQLAKHASDTIISRIYVQVHNRGVRPANNTKVYLLLADAAGANLPDLPPDFEQRIQLGAPIEDIALNWMMVGQQTLQDIRVGHPIIAAFDLSSDLLSGLSDVVLLALVHHPDDPFANSEITTDTGTNPNLILPERKATFKKGQAVNFGGTTPVVTERPPLNNYVAIPASATAADAPYDPFLAAAFSLNDSLFNRLLLAAQAAPMTSDANDGLVPDPATQRIVYASTIEVDNDIVLEDVTPLIWLAKDKITINKTINALGKGASLGNKGDFGGSGGGGAAAVGQDCEVPLLNSLIYSGGAAGADGTNLEWDWASRALQMLPHCKGGAAGGGANGGAGGGIVILCAPVIELGADGVIDVRGADGPAGSGGGGGGLVILIAGEIINASDTGTGATIKVEGGSGDGAGGRGFFRRAEIIP